MFKTAYSSKSESNDLNIKQECLYNPLIELEYTHLNLHKNSIFHFSFLCINSIAVTVTSKRFSTTSTYVDLVDVISDQSTQKYHHIKSSKKKHKRQLDVMKIKSQKQKLNTKQKKNEFNKSKRNFALLERKTI